MKFLARWAFSCAIFMAFSLPTLSYADYQHRLSLGLGFATTHNPSQTDFEIGGEYEYRYDPIFGLGAGANYIFSNPSITLIAIPDVFVHPLGTDFLVSAAPLLEFGSGTGTNVGVRVGTRVPIPLDAFVLVPSLSIDFIDGGTDYLFGLGFQF